MHSNSAEFAHANVDDHGPISNLLTCDRGRAEEDMNWVFPRAVWFQEEAVDGVNDVTHFGLAFGVVVLSKSNMSWGYSEPRIGGGIRGDHVSDVAGGVPPWRQAVR